MKKTVSIALLVLCVYAAPARASAIYSFDEVGADVVGSLSGSLDLAGATFQGTDINSDFGVQPVNGVILSGPTDVAENLYSVTGPASLGPGSTTRSTSVSGDPFALYMYGAPFLAVPAGYVSGSPLNSGMLFTNHTFADMGLTPGTYVYTLAGSRDTLTVQIGPAAPVPEPTSLLLFGSGFGAAILRLRRRKA
jgi:hypothetical protein